ncbi:hypothetical protein STRDD11_02617 [Streptococcus sp. DD11]|nr:hypothetical protein STRDD11_02617 [Streptococcus sp. DD11]
MSNQLPRQEFFTKKSEAEGLSSQPLYDSLRGKTETEHFRKLSEKCTIKRGVFGYDKLQKNSKYCSAGYS